MLYSAASTNNVRNHLNKKHSLFKLKRDKNNDGFSCRIPNFIIS